MAPPDDPQFEKIQNPDIKDKKTPNDYLPEERPTKRQKLTDAEIKVWNETSHIDFEHLSRVSQNPPYLELRLSGVMGVFNVLKQRVEEVYRPPSLRISASREIWMTYDLLMLETSIMDPRELVIEKFDLIDWVKFLAENPDCPVFPWELTVYQKIEETLTAIGVRIKGGLASLIKMKKEALEESRAAQKIICLLPFHCFEIVDVDLAKPWIKVPGCVFSDDDVTTMNELRGLEEKMSHLQLQPKVDIHRAMEDVCYDDDKLVRKTSMKAIAKESFTSGYKLGVQRKITSINSLYRRPTKQESNDVNPKQKTPPSNNPAPPTQRRTVIQGHVFNPWALIRFIHGWGLDRVIRVMTRRAQEDTRASLRLMSDIERAEIEDPAKRLFP